MADISVCIEGEATIAPATPAMGANNMVRHPDGTLWLNTTTTEPGFFRSRDQGQTWEAVPFSLPQAPPNQYIAGFTITHDGRLWTVHQATTEEIGGEPGADPRTFVSSSADEGRTWTTTAIDYPSFAPGAPEDPYVKMEVAGCHPNFVERPDGTLMFSASMRYEDWDNYLQTDQTRPGIRDVMIRSSDGGRTWGDPTIVHPHATETAYAVDPQDPDHILGLTRIQRYALPGEDGEAIKREITGVPYPPSLPWCYKNGLLIESTDGGRTFRERLDGLYGFGSYRWSVVWTEDDLLVLVSFAGQELGEPDSLPRHVARISRDGGRSWIDGTPAGTTAPNRAEKFTLVPARAADDYSDCLAATIQLDDHRYRFMSVYRYKKEQVLKGLFWRLENLP